MYAWPVAVTMDVFTHSLEMFPTPFLWPFKVYFDGISWGTPWFMILNYSLIVISFVIIFVYKLKKKRKKKVK